MSLPTSSSENVFGDVNDEHLVSCVSCGLCLPHCPTYRVSGLDIFSPRGRIAIVNSVKNGDLALDHAAIEALDSCVQCMGCLPACPSGVKYDEIIEPVVSELARMRRSRSAIKRLFLFPLGRPLLLAAMTRAGAIAQRLKVVPKRLSLPDLPLRQAPALRSNPSIGNDGQRVRLFVGCVMDAWYRPVHAATIRVLEALGYCVELTDPSMCCGALHRHSGFEKQAEAFETACYKGLAAETIIFNSAGCGAQLSRQITGARDVMTLLVEHIDRLMELCEPSAENVAIHDACHSRNILRTSADTHTVLAALYRTTALPDEGLCCGAGGAYSVHHPETALKILLRKYAAVESVAAISRIASGNPGCTAHIQAHMPPSLAGLKVVHPIELIAERLKKEAGR